MKGITKAGVGLGVALVSLWILPGQAGAARPLSTDDAGTVEARKSEMEAGYGYKDFGGTGQGISLGLKHGITEKMDLGVASGWQFDPDDGPEGMEIGVKWSLLPAKESQPGVSLTFGFAPGDPEYSLNGIVSQPLGEKLTLHLNAGYTVPEALADGAVFWGGAAEYAVHEKINLVGEMIGEEDLSDADEDCRSWLIGANAAVADFLTLDIGGGAKLSSDPGWFLDFGITLGF
jgi:hypothetical protein